MEEGAPTSVHKFARIGRAAKPGEACKPTEVYTRAGECLSRPPMCGESSWAYRRRRGGSRRSNGWRDGLFQHPHDGVPWWRDSRLPPAGARASQPHHAWRGPRGSRRPRSAPPEVESLGIGAQRRSQTARCRPRAGVHLRIRSTNSRRDRGSEGALTLGPRDRLSRTRARRGSSFPYAVPDHQRAFVGSG